MNAIQEKNPALSNKKTVAHKVGVGAVVFHDLYNQRIKNIDFSWNDVLSFEGTTGPYVQYTYARAKSIYDTTFSLVKILLGYEDAIIGAAQKYEIQGKHCFTAFPFVSYTNSFFKLLSKSFRKIFFASFPSYNT